jgi:NADH:ubiquinone oxidoreductase subunit F (NADH-binding)/(2Fe-2S) ferredoxin
MERINSLEEFETFRYRLQAAHDPNRPRLLLCGDTGCRADGSLELAALFTKELRRRKLHTKIELSLVGCPGLCQAGPVVIVYPAGIFYCRVGRQDLRRDVQEIIQTTLCEGRPVARLLYTDPVTSRRITYYHKIPFYKNQLRIVLKNTGVIDPHRIEAYIAAGGYAAMAKVLTMDPEEVINCIQRSGLRGRGGAGFPTGQKWRFCRDAKDRTMRYIICNADEGDPGAFMDRAVMEGDPHSVLEGMIIGAYAISYGVSPAEGYIYVRAEYPLAVKTLRNAIEQARASGFLGKKILGTNFNFDIYIKEGAGAFVCGEETALTASIEGKRGMPHPRPPYPVQFGLWGKPTNINNVETWASVPRIILGGADWFAGIGTEKSKGTKVFSLTGNIRNSGLIEVPMGTTLREIVYKIGGGARSGKKIKAIQTGGPSGGCIPAHLLDLPVDYESLTEAGSIMGSGSLIVMDEETCMVDVARYFLEFTMKESCGKCTPCRTGIRQMHAIIEGICAGHGKPEDIELLEELAGAIKKGSLCGLGQTAPNPVLTTLKYFRHEYEEHTLQHHCAAKLCPGLFRYEINAALCKGCSLCRKHCPAGAIAGKKKQPHTIDPQKCIWCGTCFENCPVGAVGKI